jgi:hypothetical protein
LQTKNSQVKVTGSVRHDPTRFQSQRYLDNKLPPVLQRSENVKKALGSGVPLVQGSGPNVDADRIGRPAVLQMKQKKKRVSQKENAWKEKARRAPLSESPGNSPVSYEGRSGPFDEVYSKAKLFWRGDDRSPSQVVSTGFTTKRERDKVNEPGESVILWRSGNNQDDLDPDSAVCVAKDVRGAAFFPLDKDAKYIYAIALYEVVNTHKMQQRQERGETGTRARKPERYRFDPTEEDSNQSPIWQFQEYAAHRITGTQILLGFEVEREFLVGESGIGNYHQKYPMAGIRFKLNFQWQSSVARSKRFRHVASQAMAAAKTYANWYPSDPNQYISYFGFVEQRHRADLTTMEEAAEAFESGAVTQSEPVVDTPVEETIDRRKRRGKNRLQKKKKKFRGRKRG